MIEQNRIISNFRCCYQPLGLMMEKLQLKDWSVFAVPSFFNNLLEKINKKCAKNLVVWNNCVTHTHTHILSIILY